MNYDNDGDDSNEYCILIGHCSWHHNPPK